MFLESFRISLHVFGFIDSYSNIMFLPALLYNAAKAISGLGQLVEAAQ